MDNQKKLLVIIMIIIIAIITILVISIAMINNKNNHGIEEKSDSHEIEYIAYVNEDIRLVQDYSSYYIVLECIDILNDAITNNKEDIISSIVKNGDVQNSTIKNVKHMYVGERSTSNTYYIECNNQDNNSIYLIMYQDRENITYEFEYITRDEYNNSIDTKKGKVLTNNIKKNKYNTYTIQMKSTESLISDYVEEYIRLLKEDVNEAYEKLDTEYREKRFNNSINEFKDYINKNLEKIEKAVMTDYGSSIVMNNGKASMVYVYRDTNNHDFIIKEEAVMEYKILLDEYTVKDNEYIKAYNKLNTNQKVQYNISIFFKCINEKNYKMAYNLLNEQFKQNNFKTQEQFEKYISENFFDTNLLGNIGIEDKGENTYICTCSYKDSLSSNSKTSSAQMAIRLSEGTDFEISFTIK